MGEEERSEGHSSTQPRLLERQQHLISSDSVQLRTHSGQQSSMATVPLECNHLRNVSAFSSDVTSAVIKR